MIHRIRFCEGRGFDPYENLAAEQLLLETVDEGCCVLYLWQNADTVVIGRNQNPWKECRTELLESEGGRLARRMSGGGAVFHDLGNLNFTFLLPSEEYDFTRQLDVIRRACRSLGIPAQCSGRNDLLVGGRKFSGNAFYHFGGHSYHHGTLLVDTDMTKLGRYLRPSAAKLEAKGVDSVRSRVMNLREVQPELTIETLRDALCSSFGETFGLSVDAMSIDELDGKALAALCVRNRSWEWNYGQRLPFDFSCEACFAWGEICLELAVEYGTVHRAAVFTDAMDWDMANTLESVLCGCRFASAALAKRVRESMNPYSEDIAQMLEQQDI